MRLEEIKTDAWQLSAGAFGSVVQDLDDINQSLLMIITTQKGSDPVRPLFGVDILRWIDQPMSVLIPNLINEITTQVAIYEPRASVQRVTYETNESQVTITLHWITADGLTGLTNYNYA